MVNVTFASCCWYSPLYPKDPPRAIVADILRFTLDSEYYSAEVIILNHNSIEKMADYAKVVMTPKY